MLKEGTPNQEVSLETLNEEVFNELQIDSPEIDEANEKEEFEDQDKSEETSEVDRTVKLESDLQELEEIIKVEKTHQRMLRKAFETHAGSSIKNCRIAFLYFDDSATQQRSREFHLNLVSDLDNGNLINLGLKKFPFTRKDIMEVYKNFDDIVSLCEGLFEDQIKEYEKQKEEKEKAKEKKNKQLTLVDSTVTPPDPSEEEDAYFSSVKVNKKIFMELEGEFVPMVFETKPLDRNTYVISLNGKDYFSKMDLLMIYSKYDKIMEKYMG